MANSPLAATMATLLLILCLSSGGDVKLANGDSWCIALPKTDDPSLQSNIDYACSKINCSSIKLAGSCYMPNTLINHASFAMNLYYKNNGKAEDACSFNQTGAITITNPEYDSCS